MVLQCAKSFGICRFNIKKRSDFRADFQRFLLNRKQFILNCWHRNCKYNRREESGGKNDERSQYQQNQNIT